MSLCNKDKILCDINPVDSPYAIPATQQHRLFATSLTVTNRPLPIFHTASIAQLPHPDIVSGAPNTTYLTQASASPKTTPHPSFVFSCQHSFPFPFRHNTDKQASNMVRSSTRTNIRMVRLFTSSALLRDRATDLRNAGMIGCRSIRRCGCGLCRLWLDGSQIQAKARGMTYQADILDRKADQV